MEKMLFCKLSECQIVLKTYGKIIELDKVAKIFIRLFQGFCPEKVIKAFDTHLINASEFPTPNDIKNIIEGNKKYDYVIYSQICKKLERGDILTYVESDYKSSYEKHIYASFN
jgi:hypothetical protein